MYDYINRREDSMKMYDCDVCLSAGSVNQWGYCEICGEEYEDLQSQVDWMPLSRPAVMVGAGESGVDSDSEDKFMHPGKDAA